MVANNYKETLKWPHCHCPIHCSLGRIPFLELLITKLRIINYYSCMLSTIDMCDSLHFANDSSLLSFATIQDQLIYVHACIRTVHLVENV